MCRSIKTLFNSGSPVSDEEVRGAAVQFVRKISGFNKPSKKNEEVFNKAVDEMTVVIWDLLKGML